VLRLELAGVGRATVPRKARSRLADCASLPRATNRGLESRRLSPTYRAGLNLGTGRSEYALSAPRRDSVPVMARWPDGAVGKALDDEIEQVAGWGDVAIARARIEIVSRDVSEGWVHGE